MKLEREQATVIAQAIHPIIKKYIEKNKENYKKFVQQNKREKKTNEESNRNTME